MKSLRFLLQKKRLPSLPSANKKEDEVPLELTTLTHKENTFIDFNRDRLLPIMCSNRGPALAVGDVDQDGEEDIFLGGGKNQTNQLWLGGDNELRVKEFEAQQRSEAVKAQFFDADQDGDLDLWVANGGQGIYPFQSRTQRSLLRKCKRRINLSPQGQSFSTTGFFRRLGGGGYRQRRLPRRICGGIP